MKKEVISIWYRDYYSMSIWMFDMQSLASDEIGVLEYMDEIPPYKNIYIPAELIIRPNRYSRHYVEVDEEQPNMMIG
jgi:hypothetical protein